MKKIYKLSLRQLLLVVLLVLLFSTNVQATVYTLDLALSGQNEVPANPSTATGILMGTYDDASNMLSFDLMFNGLTGATTAAHFHGPAAPGVNGPVIIPLVGFPVGVTSGSYSNTYVLTPEQESQLLCGMWYINIHTAVYPGGELRSQLKEGITAGFITTFELAITGLKEVPPNASTATGILTGTYDAGTNVLSFDVMFNGLTGLTTAAHFHGPALPILNAGVQIGLAGFPVGVTSGTYSNSFVLTPEQAAQLIAGLWYINIHTGLYPGGEIRSQLTEGTLDGNCAMAPAFTLDLALSGQNEVPANPSTATGILMGTYDDAANILSFDLMFNGLTGTTTAAHFHGPAGPGENGPVLIPLVGFPVGVTSGAYSNTYVLTPEQESHLLCGMLYINIHTSVYPGGELRSQLKEGTTVGNISTLELAITGLKEVAPTASSATGTMIGTYDAGTNVLSFDVMFNGLAGPATAAHFHGPALVETNAGVQIALAGFPVGVTSGSYSNSFVLTDEQETQLLSGHWYINIHTAVYPGGEIRSQLTEGTLDGNCSYATIPVENWSLLLGGLLIGIYAFFMIRRRS